MTMTFWEIVAANIVSTTLTSVFLIAGASILLGRTTGRGLQYMLRILGALLFFVIGCAFLGAVMLKTGWMYIPYLSNALIEYSQIAIGTLILKALYGMKWKPCWFTTLIISVITKAGSYLGLLFLPYSVIHLNVMTERLTYMFFLWFVSSILLIITLFILYKTGAGQHYRHWLDYGVIRWDLFIFMSSYPLLLTFISRMIGQFQKQNGENILTTIFLLMLTYMVFIHISRQDMQKEQIKTQQVHLQQQIAYIENLESLQQETRRFRHDFKNMMSGMYLQAKDGDMAAVQDFIQSMTTDFDTQVGSQLRLMNQLANIHELSVKSLLLTKLETIKQKNIRCNLEVLRPFDNTRMGSMDLCRCLGIIIDNAIEAVQNYPNGQIHILISHQENYTTFLVKNTLHEAVNFHKIGTEGYSTKGDGRGIGLNNYHRILRQYDFVMPVTTIKDNYFIQELKIKET